MGRFLWLFTPVFFITSVIQLIAISSYFSDYLQWNGFISFIVAFFLTWFPVLGSLSGILGAVLVWHWNTLFAILLFIWPTLLFFNNNITYGLITKLCNRTKIITHAITTVFIDILKIFTEIVLSKLFIYFLVITVCLFLYATLYQQQQISEYKQNHTNTPSLKITDNKPESLSKTDDKANFSKSEPKTKPVHTDTLKQKNYKPQPQPQPQQQQQQQQQHNQTVITENKQREIIDTKGSTNGQYIYFTTALWDGKGKQEYDFSNYQIEQMDNKTGGRKVIARTESADTIVDNLILSNDEKTLFFQTHTLNTATAIYGLNLQNSKISFITYGKLVCQVKHKNFDGNYKNQLVIIQHSTQIDPDRNIALYTPQGEKLGVIGGSDTTKRDLDYFCTSVDNSAFK
ncbi:hypothetical protein GL503_06670 [Salmonella enterica]|uniref:Uncharacterized protein n=1 Tax=Salmonella enterica I TaxID=59201 RepID=A0A3R1B3N7_SALET|nr:hypothetical protein [Salmonella enterica]MML53482.1 hypothetical protein [Salmonella enterica subsp. enterica serovar Kidderminster]